MVEDQVAFNRSIGDKKTDCYYGVTKLLIHGIINSYLESDRCPPSAIARFGELIITSKNKKKGPITLSLRDNSGTQPDEEKIILPHFEGDRMAVAKAPR